MATTRTRVLLLANSVSVGGMEEHMRLLALKLDRESFEVTAALPDDENLRTFEPALRSAADELVLVTPDRRYGLRRNARECVKLFRLARAHRFDVAHLHSTSYDGHTFATLTLRLAGVRRIFLTEHLAPESPPPPVVRVARDLTVRMLTGVVCVSELNRQRRGKAFRNPPGRTHVVNNGVDLDRFEAEAPEKLAALRTELDLAPDSLVVGTAIRLEEGKGVDDLVAAFALVAATHPDARLLIVGDGSLRNQLERQAQDLGVSDACRFVGFKTDPRPYIQLMHAFVLPVPFGSASIGLLEAMAMERVCVITFGGDGEAPEPGVSGYWARPNDPASIAEDVSAILDDPDRREAMGKAARVRVETSFSAGSVAEHLGRLYVGG